MSHGHHGHSHGLSVAASSAITRRITRYAIGVAALLIVLKAIAWVNSGSVSVMASLADSILDLVASLVTFFAVRYAASPPDAKHRFGHGKAEAFAGLMQGVLVLASAALVGREAVVRYINPMMLEGESRAITVMVFSMALTSLLVVAQSRALKETGSVAVAGDRLHYAADLASNAVALIGIALAAYTRDPRIDAVAGGIVALWLVWGAISVMRGAAGQLMDEEMSEVERSRIIALMTEDGRVTGVHNLRTRVSGPTIHIQLHADLDSTISLAAAHQAIAAAEARIKAVYPAADVIIHPDPKSTGEVDG